MGQDWRDRLMGAIVASGRSQRELSLKAGLAAGYVNSLFKEGKDPSVTNLLKILDQLNVSFSYILYGIGMTPDTEDLLRLYASLTPRQKQVFRDMAESMAEQRQS